MNKNRVNKVRFKTHFCASQSSISSCSSIVFGVCEVLPLAGFGLRWEIGATNTVLGEGVNSYLLRSSFIPLAISWILILSSHLPLSVFKFTWIWEEVLPKLLSGGCLMTSTLKWAKICPPSRGLLQVFRFWWSENNFVQNFLCFIIYSLSSFGILGSYIS